MNPRPGDYPPRAAKEGPASPTPRRFPGLRTERTPAVMAGEPHSFASPARRPANHPG